MMTETAEASAEPAHMGVSFFFVKVNWFGVMALLGIQRTD